MRTSHFPCLQVLAAALLLTPAGCAGPGLAVGLDVLGDEAEVDPGSQPPCEQWMWVSFPPGREGGPRLRDLILGLDEGVTQASVLPVEGEREVWRIAWTGRDGPAGTLFLSTREGGFDLPELYDPAVRTHSNPDMIDPRFGAHEVGFTRRTRGAANENGGGLMLLLKADGSHDDLILLGADPTWTAYDVLEVDPPR